MDTCVGRSEPQELVVTTLKVADATVIIVVVLAIDNVAITPHVRIVTGKEEPEVGTQLHTQTAAFVEFEGVTQAQACASTLAFPAFGFAKADAINHTFGIG